MQNWLVIIYILVLLIECNFDYYIDLAYRKYKLLAFKLKL